LLKTEPEEYSYEQLERDGRTVWDGVTNKLALKHLRAIRRGDLVFVYHTGSQKQIVGVAGAVSDPYPDPRKKNPKLMVVDLKPKERLRRPVTLGEIKGVKEFSGFELVRLPRLSVMPVDKVKWDGILGLSRSAAT
jgi:predicted RNA-binding protein with PUA-like domain